MDFILSQHINNQNSTERPVNSLDAIFLESLRKRIFQVVPNFTDTHSAFYIGEWLKNEIIQLEKGKKRFFYLFSHSLDEKIFDKQNVDLLCEFKKLGGEIKIVLKSSLTNRFINDIPNCNQHLKVMHEKMRSFPAISCIVTLDSYAEEIKEDQDHKALFFLNVDKSTEKDDEIYTKRKEFLKTIFDSLWNKLSLQSSLSN